MFSTDEIFTVGPNFKQASNFLWPFKLSNPTGGFRPRKLKHFIQGGEGKSLVSILSQSTTNSIFQWATVKSSSTHSSPR